MEALFSTPSHRTQRNQDGQPPRRQGTTTCTLHAAAETPGSAEKVGSLLGDGAQVDAVDAAGRTPLMLAVAKHDDASVIRALLAHGASVDVCNHAGETALHTAVQQGSADSVSLLLGSTTDVDKESSEGLTPLMVVPIS